MMALSDERGPDIDGGISSPGESPVSQLSMGKSLVVFTMDIVRLSPQHKAT